MSETRSHLVLHVDEKEELVDRILHLYGREPDNLRPILNLLTVPSILPFTKKFVNGSDPNTKCQFYTAPWNCALESEAKYENERHGWLAQGGELAYQWWCNNCRAKATEM